MNSFHVSGKPGRHQWMQSANIAGLACCSGLSILPWRMVWTEVCASFLYSDNLVMLRKWIGTFMAFVTLAAIANSLRSVPTFSGIDVLSIGAVSFAHFMPSGLSQSKLLSKFFAIRNSNFIARNWLISPIWDYDNMF